MRFRINDKIRIGLGNRGFTFVEILGAVAIMGILSGIAIIGVTRYREKQIQLNYDSMAKSAYVAFSNMNMDDFSSNDNITLTELSKKDLISRPADPLDNEKDCTGYIEKIIDSSGMIDADYYTVDLCCTNYTKKYDYTDPEKVVLSESTYCTGGEVTEDKKHDSSCDLKFDSSQTKLHNGWYNSLVKVQLSSDNVDAKKGVSSVSSADAKNKAIDSDSNISVEINKDFNGKIYGFVESGILDKNCDKKLKVDVTPPTKPNVEVYRWNGKTDPKGVKKGLTKYVENSISDSKLMVLANGSTDAMSGIDHYEYKIDGGSYKTISGGYFNITELGEHTIYVKAVDKANNDSSLVSFDVNIDDQIPKCPTVISSTVKRGTYTKGNINLTFNMGTVTEYSYYIGKKSKSSDSYSYTLAGNGTSKNNVITIPSSGSKNYNAIKLVVKDQYGNTRNNCEYKDYMIDTSAPSCSIKKTTTNSPNGVDVKVTCSDSDSGVSTCAGVSGSSASKNNLKNDTSFTVKDKAGNTATCKLNVSSKNQYRYVQKKDTASTCTSSCCGYKTCANSACGVASYKKCSNCSACGKKVSPSSPITRTAQKISIPCYTPSCPSVSGYSHGKIIDKTVYASRSTAQPCRVVITCSYTKNITTCKSCVNKACGVASYKKCATKACGNKSCTSSKCCGTHKVCGSSYGSWGGSNTGCKSDSRKLYY